MEKELEVMVKEERRGDKKFLDEERESYNKEIGLKFAKARTAKELSQFKVATEVLLDRATYARIEAGKCPSLRYADVMRIAKFLDISIV